MNTALTTVPQGANGDTSERATRGQQAEFTHGSDESGRQLRWRRASCIRQCVRQELLAKLRNWMIDGEAM